MIMTSQIISSRILLISAIAVLAAVGLFRFSTIQFTDDAFLGDDTWEYQSLAVNVAYGHGYPVFGAVEPFSTYKFNEGIESVLYDRFCTPVYNNFYRTPGYPVFLAAVYRIWGVRPALAKQIQFFLILVALMLLPVAGFLLWGRRGIAAGGIAGVLCSYRFFDYAKEIITEPLITFITGILFFLFVCYSKKQKPYLLLILAISCASGLYIKGSLIFVPILISMYLFVLGFKKRVILIHFVAFVILQIALILPYSLWASLKAGHPIVLSTQSNRVLLAGNNERVLLSGGWEPGWQTDKNSFYNRPEIAGVSDSKKVCLFWMANSKKLPVTLWRKFVAGMGETKSFGILFWLLATMLLLSTLLHETGKYRKALSILVLSVFYAVLPAMGIVLNAPVFNFGVTVLFFLSSIACTKSTDLFHLLSKQVSAPFMLLWTNFFLITVVLFGYPRFIRPFEPCVWLVSCNCVLYTAIRIHEKMHLSVRWCPW